MRAKRCQVFVTQPIPKQVADLFEQNNIELIVNEANPLQKSFLVENIKNYDGLICTLNDKIDKEVLSNIDPARFKALATISVGYDHIDIEECNRLKIPVGFTPEVSTDAMAEFTIGLLLNVSRRITELIGSLRMGEWKRWDLLWMCGQGLHGSNIGIFGLGRIGYAVAKRLKNFNVNKILYYDRYRNLEAEKELECEYTDLNGLLETSDFLMVTCAATKETERLFNYDMFKRMKKNAIFINVARGSVVDQEDLCRALKEKLILAAGLDVCTPEPLPLSSELLQLDNCIVTPHMGSADVSTRIKMAMLSANNIINCLNGQKMIHQVNKF